jgi:hypothetical protein
MPGDFVEEDRPSESKNENNANRSDPAPRILATSLGTQTDVSPTSKSISTQADIPIPRITTEVEVQTEESTSRSPSPQEGNDALASSSSTVLPPTPKVDVTPLDMITSNSPTDLPPSYNQVASETPFMTFYICSTPMTYLSRTYPIRESVATFVLPSRRCLSGTVASKYLSARP